MRNLWEVGTAGARKLGKRLNDLALVARDPWSGNLRLHAVIAAFLFRRRRSELSQLHGRLLDACRPISGRWADLPAGESYLWRRLSSHLLTAGRQAELRDILLDLAFLQAKLEATDIHSLIADFDLAAGDDHELSLVREALRQSAGVLGSGPHAAGAAALGPASRPPRAGSPAVVERSPRPARECRAETEVRELRQAGSAGCQYAQHSAEPSADGGLRLPRRLRRRSGPASLEPGDCETVSTVEGHTSTVTAVALVAGRQILSGSLDKTLRLWDLGTGCTLRVLTGHTASNHRR